MKRIISMLLAAAMGGVVAGAGMGLLVLCGASSVEQITECAQAPANCTFTPEEYAQIDAVVSGKTC